MRTIMATIVVLALVFSQYAESAEDAERAKEFPDHRCRLLLPAPDFVWLDHSHIPDSIAAFGNGSGMMLILLVLKTPDDFAVGDSFSNGFDEGITQSGDLSKISGEIITFRGVPCYQMHTRINQDGSIATTKAFGANGYLYQLQLIGSKLPINERGNLEKVFASFEFLGAPRLPELKPASRQTKPYKFSRMMGRIAAYCIIGIIILVVVKSVIRKRKRTS